MNFSNSRLVDHKPMKFGTFVPYMYRSVIIVKYLTNFFKLEWNLGIKFTLRFLFLSVYICPSCANRPVMEFLQPYAEYPNFDEKYIPHISVIIAAATLDFVSLMIHKTKMCDLSATPPFPRTQHVCKTIQQYTYICRGSNPRPYTCKANALSLSHIPN